MELLTDRHNTPQILGLTENENGGNSTRRNSNFHRPTIPRAIGALCAPGGAGRVGEGGARERYEEYPLECSEWNRLRDDVRTPKAA